MNNIEWIPTKERLPEKSGEYLVFVAYTLDNLKGMGNESVIVYSARHKKFNTFDSMDEETAQRLAFPHVTHWAELPEPPEGWRL